MNSASRRIRNLLGVFSSRLFFIEPSTVLLELRRRSMSLWQRSIAEAYFHNVVFVTVQGEQLLPSRVSAPRVTMEASKNAVHLLLPLLAQCQSSFGQKETWRGCRRDSWFPSRQGWFVERAQTTAMFRPRQRSRPIEEKGHFRANRSHPRRDSLTRRPGISRVSETMIRVGEQVVHGKTFSNEKDLRCQRVLAMQGCHV